MPVAVPAEGETAAVYCQRPGCGHSAVISLARFPPGWSSRAIARRLICSRCGSKDIGIMQDMQAHYARVHAAYGQCQPLPEHYRVVGRDVPWPER